jgi:maltooligosyltrehalose trehalohydrolase
MGAMSGKLPTQGAELGPDGVRYCVWAPERKGLAVRILARYGEGERVVPLSSDAPGYHSALDPKGRAGDRYLIVIEDGAAFPSPASRFQPDGVHGPSQVVDSSAYRWSDGAWVRPPFRDLVIYELHLGTFTTEGTYRAAIGRLPFLRELGVNAVEIMPLADFPGGHNWGYDGVHPYAPARAYGQPDELRALVDAAHGEGIAVILDVVFNHLGPDGNYLRCFSPHYFESDHHTPWGEAINFSRENCAAVRAFFRDNLVYWMRDFHLDGFRLDATHAIIDDTKPHILAELAETVRALGGYIIAEDERNEASLITPSVEGGCGFDAVWADDFHHSVENALMDVSMYACFFSGDLAELAETIQEGWVYRGQPRLDGKMRPGTPCRHLPPERFVFCISNHDQCGNRAFGERLNHLTSPDAYRAASVLLCLTPYTPMLFMGQEWAASAPFQYFTDHNEDLGRLVDKGRRGDMEKFPVFAAMLANADIPAPQNPATFERSKLDWDEIEREPHAACLRLYREALRLRHEHPAFRPHSRAGYRVAAMECGVLALRLTAGNVEWLILADLLGGHAGKVGDDEMTRLPSGETWRLVLRSNAAEFGGREPATFDERTGRFAIEAAETIVLQSTR